MTTSSYFYQNSDGVISVLKTLSLHSTLNDTQIHFVEFIKSYINSVITSVWTNLLALKYINNFTQKNRNHHSTKQRSYSKTNKKIVKKHKTKKWCKVLEWQWTLKELPNFYLVPFLLVCFLKLGANFKQPPLRNWSKLWNPKENNWSICWQVYDKIISTRWTWKLRYFMIKCLQIHTYIYIWYLTFNWILFFFFFIFFCFFQQFLNLNWKTKSQRLGTN